MRLFGASRTLIFLPLPTGALLAKLGELANSPPYLISHEEHHSELRLKTDKGSRRNAFLVNLVRFGGMVAVAIGGSVIAFAVSLGASVLFAALMFVAKLTSRRGK